MKRPLPRAHGREHAREHAHASHAAYVAPLEREELNQHVVAIAQSTTGPAAAELAVEVVRALVAEGLAVSALVTTDDPNADAQAALAALHDAGAVDTAWVRVARDSPKPALERALARFAGDAAAADAPDKWLVVLGNTLPVFYRPQLCVLVTTPRSTHLPEAQRLVAYAQLQVSAPSPKLAAELAKLIKAKALARRASSA